MRQRKREDEGEYAVSSRKRRGGGGIGVWEERAREQVREVEEWRQKMRGEKKTNGSRARRESQHEPNMAKQMRGANVWRQRASQLLCFVSHPAYIVHTNPLDDRRAS